MTPLLHILKRERKASDSVQGVLGGGYCRAFAVVFLMLSDSWVLIMKLWLRNAPRLSRCPLCLSTSTRRQLVAGGTLSTPYPERGHVHSTRKSLTSDHDQLRLTRGRNSLNHPARMNVIGADRPWHRVKGGAEPSNCE